RRFGSDMTKTDLLVRIGDEKLLPAATLQRIFFCVHSVKGLAPVKRPEPSPRQPNGCATDGSNSTEPRVSSAHTVCRNASKIQQAFHLRFGHRPRSDAIEDRELIAALVHGAVALEALGDADACSSQCARGDEARNGSWRPALVRRWSAG